MRTSVSIAVLTSIGALAVMPSACGGERAAMPRASSVATQPRAACVARFCGLAPPRRRVDEGIALKLTPVAGDSFWAVLPDELASGVVAVPRIPLRISAGLTTSPPREAADRYCDGFPECTVAVVDRAAVPSGVMTRWDDASGTIRDLDVTTVDLGAWTLVALEPDATRAARVARALRWNVDEDLYPRVLSTDRGVPVDVDWAGVSLWALQGRDVYVLIDILPGCRLSAKQPDLGGSDARSELELHDPDTVAGGRWCVDGYAIDVNFAERPRLELLHEKLGIVAAGREG